MTALPSSPDYRPLAPSQRFPPIPGAPDGVNIVSFDDFAPSGIEVPVDEIGDMIEPDERYEEHDALGIATAVLPSHKKDHHSLMNRRKKLVAPSEKNPSARNAWWDVWDETESVRKKLYNQYACRARRLYIKLIINVIGVYLRLKGYPSPPRTSEKIALGPLPPLEFPTSGIR